MYKRRLQTGVGTPKEILFKDPHFNNSVISPKLNYAKYDFQIWQT